MRRLLDSEWSLSVMGLVLGGLAVWGLVAQEAPGWARWGASALALLAFLGPALPLLALLPWHVVAVRRGLIRRSRIPPAIRLDEREILVEHGGKLARCQWAEISRARRAANGNWTGSKMLEDALGLFSSNGRELLRVPLSAAGTDALLRELGTRGVPIEEVLVSAPSYLD